MTPLHYKEGYKYQTTRDFACKVPIYPTGRRETDWIRLSPAGELWVRGGYAWDGASGPTLDTRSTMRASLIHDALYQLMRQGHLSARRWKRVADAVLEKTMIADGAWKLRANVWERMLSRFGRAATLPSAEPPELVAP